jgi:hypothetical protein
MISIASTKSRPSHRKTIDARVVFSSPTKSTPVLSVDGEEELCRPEPEARRVDVLVLGDFPG